MPARLTVRMYDVGFGDCFLIGVHDGDASRWILIDCGTITEAKAQLTRVVDDILRQCSGADGVARLALVVATHRHKDHVWGFADPRWGEVAVGEVWMPWTEDPNDPRATSIRERQSALAIALAPPSTDGNPLTARPAGERAAQAQSRAADAMALNALTNAAAMATLHGGFADKVAPAFLPEADTTCQRRMVAGLDGVAFHVLGPPRDEAALKLMDPPESVGYLRWPTRIPRRQAAPPFAPRYRIEDPGHVPGVEGSTFRFGDRAAVRKAVEEPAGRLGAALDNAVNNTSLVLMLEAGEHFLLFPGDAQWGSWQAMLAQTRCRELLARTSLLKVGHHGSHNATPRALIEEIAPKPIAALFSTKPVTQWPNIPRAPLLAAMGGRCDRIARTDDEEASAAAGFRVEPGLYVEWSS